MIKLKGIYPININIMGLNHRRFAESNNFSVEGNKISDVKLDLSSVDMRLLESLGFKCDEKQVGREYYYTITVPENYTISDIGISKYNDYFGDNSRGMRTNKMNDYIIENQEGNQFCILSGKLTKSIKEIELDIEARRQKRIREENELNIKKRQEKYFDAIFSTMELGSYRSDNLKIGEQKQGGILPACFISKHDEGNISKLELLGFEVNNNEKYQDLYDIKVPKKFKLEFLDYHLKVLGNSSETIATFYYKRDFGKIINLDLQEVYNELDLEKVQEENDIHILAGTTSIVYI